MFPISKWQILEQLKDLAIAYVLALPLGWERGRPKRRDSIVVSVLTFVTLRLLARLTHEESENRNGSIAS